MDQLSPTLLMLNDHCLLEMSKFLDERDCVSLANTCHRLRNIAASALAPKYKTIAVQVIKYPDFSFYNHPACTGKKTKAQVMEILSLVGDSVSSFEFIGNSPFIYEMLNKLPNLKELKIGNDFVITQLTDYISRNKQLESIECRYDCNVFELLEMLPNLTELRLNDLPDVSIDRNKLINGLLSLNGLTKLSFTSFYNCNELLIEIAKKLQLAELVIYALVTFDTFHIIKSFGNLERLSIINSKQSHRSVEVPENVVLPPQLRSIKFGRIDVSCDWFLSIVKNLTLLNEFDIGDGYIIAGKESTTAELFPRRMSHPADVLDFASNFAVIFRIVNELRVELSQRSLKIIYHDNYNAPDKQIFPHNLERLTIVNSWFDREPQKSVLITVYEQHKRKFSRCDSTSSSDASGMVGSI